MYENETLGTLKEKCRARGLPVSGSKAQVIDRLRGNKSRAADNYSLDGLSCKLKSARLDDLSFDEVFDRKIVPLTGGWEQLQVETVKKVKQIIRKSKTEPWVGFTSNGEKGCENRWNQTYKHKPTGLNRMARIYTTESNKFKKKMETYLTEELKGELANERMGGAGPDGSGELSVYVVWKE